MKAALASLAALVILAKTAAAMPRYEHIFIIIEENRTASEIIGNPAAPNINRLAREYGVAANYYAVTHPSEPNYVALLGGDTFGIVDDDAYYCRRFVWRAGCRHVLDLSYADHTVRAPSLTDQLAARGLTWKGYFQSIPAPGSPVYQSADGRYAAKHNGFMTFKSVQDDPRRAEKIVGFDALDADIARGTLPAFAEIIPDQCNDMHGIGGWGAPAGCQDAAALVRRADRMIGDLTGRIMRSSAWTGPGNSAIVITFDEGNGDSATHPNGCCGTLPGGGWIATVVVTNHGPRGISDPRAYNHYALLRTVEDAFGLAGHLGHAARAADMTPLFAVPGRSPLAPGPRPP